MALSEPRCNGESIRVEKIMIGWPNISVIIATYNRPRSLGRLLSNLKRQENIHPRQMEVCVVDDGSDARFEPPESYPFRYNYLYRDRLPDGLSRVYSSRNLAASMTTGEWILQLDDDLEIELWAIGVLQSWGAMLDFFNHKAVLVPRMSNNSDVDLHDNGFNRGLDGRWFRGKAQWQQTHWESSTSAGMFMSRKLWNEVQGYDEQFDSCMGAADHELVLRCQKTGAEVWLMPIYVNISDEESGSWRMPMIDKALQMGRERNETIFNRKHPDSREWTNFG